METLLITVLTLCSLGVLAALVLFFVARRFRVEEDPRIDEVERMAADSPAAAAWPMRSWGATTLRVSTVRWAVPSA